MSKEPTPTIDVLYVEDAIDQALSVKAFFNALPGFRVVHAQDGDKALSLIESRDWDLVVTDLNLPGSDGFSVVRAARAKSASLPILVTTGYTQTQYEEQALRAGADQVMIKPLNQNDFVSRIWSMIERDDEPAAEPAGNAVVVIAGHLGDAEMGCGGTLRQVAESGTQVVVLPLLPGQHEDLPAEMKAASIAADILGFDLRLDPAVFGDEERQNDLVQRTIEEVRPFEVYVPFGDDQDPARRVAHRSGSAFAARVESLLAYQTASTGLGFRPGRFVEVQPAMVFKMEALAAYQSMGASRDDLQPRLAQAYARYWGRFRDFSEVEAFEQIRTR